jgi:hypothetical protein
LSAAGRFANVRIGASSHRSSRRTEIDRLINEHVRVAGRAAVALHALRQGSLQIGWQ